jgi:hypothetical protein
LRFVADALSVSPELAVAARGGLEPLLHRSAVGVADSFRIRLELGLPIRDPVNDRRPIRIPAPYELEIGPDPSGDLGLAILDESWQIDSPRIQARPD